VASATGFVRTLLSYSIFASVGLHRLALFVQIRDLGGVDFLGPIGDEGGSRKLAVIDGDLNMDFGSGFAGSNRSEPAIWGGS